MDRDVSVIPENSNTIRSPQRNSIDNPPGVDVNRLSQNVFDDGEISEVGPVASYNDNLLPSENFRQHLTVNNKPKTDETFKKDTIAAIPYLSTFVKWLATLILGFVLLGTLVTSKISIIYLAGSYNSTDSMEKPGNHTQFSMLLIVLLLPNVITLIRSLWIGGLRYSPPWPDTLGIILCISSSLLESAGLSLFVFRQLEKHAVISDITFLNMVFFFTILYNVYRCCRIGVARVKEWFVLFLVAMLFEVTGIGLSFYASLETAFKDDPNDFVELVGAVLLISVAWIPSIKKRQLHTHNPNLQQSDSPLDESIFRMNSKTTRWKAGIISSFFKIVFICIIAGSLNQEFVNDLFKHKNNIWHWQANASLQTPFLVNLVSSFSGFCLAFLTCHMSLDIGAFALPIFLSTPISTMLFLIPNACQTLVIIIDARMSPDICYETIDAKDSLNFILSYSGLAFLVVAEILATWYIVWKRDTAILPNESQIFWIPGFNGVLLDEWLVLSRCHEPIETNIDFREQARRTRIYICTTMYRESDNEMKQLLESINRVNAAQHRSVRHFEAHIFFDGGVKETQPTEFALQLLSLLPETLDIKLVDCRQIQTPYGLCLAWKLPAPPGRNEMKFRIHFKDNLKVKNKKRWSQIMYMSYVLDFLLKKEKNNPSGIEGFILTTDADVLFTPVSVEALMDLMTRDEAVGAVCARTHPLGDGPVVWYQVFEYAIGHWFQKASEHVLGSVLCSPGCFSVYRCKAIFDIMPSYASTVNEAFEFLIKDMGEDRWLCTLMIQNGWRIEYCAVASNSTYCPDSFDDLFKQRRRWIASTIANMMLFIKEWRLLIRYNKEISFVFILYQALLLFSTLIGPSIVVLVVSGGLQYGWQIEPIACLIIQYFVCILFGVICLFSSSRTQLQSAKFLTFIYAIVMSVVVIGTAVQIAKDIQENQGVSDVLPLSISDLYLFGLMGIFILTSLLHITEVHTLLNGIWYLLCIPSGYLVLMIYSVCNLTDKSWGTREEQSGPSVDSAAWYTHLWTCLNEFCPCFNQSRAKLISQGCQTSQKQTNKIETDSEDEAETTKQNSPELAKSFFPPDQNPFLSHNNRGQYRPVPVEKWLPAEFKKLYVSKFYHYGYEDTRLISGMKESELEEIGIKFKGHRQRLLQRIKLLPDFEPNTEVPETADEWLENIGLTIYKKNFAENQIITRRDMAVLKSMRLRDIKKELDIRKAGHIKRLYQSIQKLRDPTKEEQTRANIRHDLMTISVQTQADINPEENAFWEALRKACLVPDPGFGRDEELKEKLGDLRNNWVLIMAVSNSLWLVIITTMVAQARLTVLNSSPLGFLFLVVFGLIFVVQFLCMLVHRLKTLIHVLARAPYRFGDGYKTSWSFSDNRLISNKNKDVNDFEAVIARKKAEDKKKLEESICSQQATYGTIEES